MKRSLLFAVLAVTMMAQAAFGASGGATVICRSDAAPINFGLSDLEKSIAESNVKNVRIVVSVGTSAETEKLLKSANAKLPRKAESFVIAANGSDVAVVGTDVNGTMYGLLELAERIHMDGAKALAIKTPVVQSPNVEFRAVNPFLVLPYGDEKNWWFLQDDFWKGYIDMLARSRINWIDLHGMYDIRTTHFPNIYPYFIKSDKFPLVGVTPQEADRNLAMLKKVMRMAKDRGIKFAMMSYSASWSGPGLRKGPYDGSEANQAEYTREVVRKTIQQCPDLDMIGFRIGESGKSGDFFRKSYIPAIKESGRDIDLYTRSWGASKESIMEIGREFPGRLYVEIKYNGEQYGPAHIVAGARAATGWRGDYSYQDFFVYPKAYKVIWQVRVNGTHRVFPWGSPDFAARTSRNSHLGGTVGFCTEPITSYYPQYNYLQKGDYPYKWWKWGYQRDWFFYDVWGRMSYNPDVPERVWIRKFKDRYGSGVGESFYRAFVTASEIVPYAFSAYSQGPDHRNHAPELETGGSVKEWAEMGPFDGQNIQSPEESARRAVNNDPSARLNAFQVADMLTNLGTRTRKYLGEAKKAGSSSKEFNASVCDLEMLADLADYCADRFRSAECFSAYKLTSAQWLADACRDYHAKATEHWKTLASLGDAQYKPFVDTLRMETENFSWTKEGEKLAGQLKPLDDLEKDAPQPAGAKPVSRDLFLPRGDKKGPAVAIKDVRVTPVKNGFRTITVRADVKDPSGVKAVLFKFKTGPSEAIWRTIPMRFQNGAWSGGISFPSQGLMWCLETVDNDDNGTMWPDFRSDIPYRYIDSWDDPALRKAGVEIAVDEILAGKAGYSAMFIGRDSSQFSKLPMDVKAKILKAVKAGVPLVIEWQDPSSFDFSWIPGIKVKPEEQSKITLDTRFRVFRGMNPELTRLKIVNGTLESDDPEWQFVAAPKVAAYRRYGKGVIFISQINRRDRIENFGIRFIDGAMGFVDGGNVNRKVLLLDAGDSTTGKLLLGVNTRVFFCDRLQ